MVRPRPAWLSSAKAGPGPQTATFRAGSKPRLVRSADTHGPVAGSPPGHRQAFAWRRLHSHVAERKPTFAIVGAVPAAKVSALSGLLSTPRPPPENIMRQLRAHAAATRINQMSSLWWQNPKLDLDDQTARAISSALVRWINRVKHRGLRAMYVSQADEQRERYGAVLAMAIECAAQNRYKALLNLMLTQLAAGLPSEALDAIRRTKDRMRDLQGINYSDLFSLDRKTRLAARLTGHWLSEVHAVQVMAACMLDQLDSADMLKMLDFNGNFRQIRIPNELRSAICSAAMTGSKSSNPLGRATASSGRFGLWRDTNEAFSRAMERAQFAQAVYHPSAFIDNLNNLGRTRAVEQLNNRYDTVLAGISGPKATYFVIDDTEKSQPSIITSHSQIVIGTKIFVTFIYVFQRTQQVQRIKQLVDTDLPDALGSMIPTAVLLIAIRAMAKLSTSTRCSQADQAAATACVASWLKEVTRRGEADTDAARAARLYALCGLKRRTEANEMARKAVSGSMGHVGPLFAEALLQTMTERSDKPESAWAGAMKLLQEFVSGRRTPGSDTPLFAELNTNVAGPALAKLARDRARQMMRARGTPADQLLQEFGGLRSLVLQETFRSPSLSGTILASVLSLSKDPKPQQDIVREFVPGDWQPGAQGYTSGCRGWTAFTDSYASCNRALGFTVQTWNACDLIATAFADGLRAGNIKGASAARAAPVFHQLLRSVVTFPPPRGLREDPELQRMDVMERIIAAWPSDVYGPFEPLLWIMIPIMLDKQMISQAKAPVDHYLRCAWGIWKRVEPHMVSDPGAGRGSGARIGPICQVVQAFLKHGDAAQSYVEELVADIFHLKLVPHHIREWKVWYPYLERMGFGAQFDAWVEDSKQRPWKVQELDEEPEDVAENILGSAADQADAVDDVSAEAEEEEDGLETIGEGGEDLD